MQGRERLISISLAGVAVSLLLVGVVSATILRHIIQVVPIVLVLALTLRGTDWAHHAARPIFLFWFVIMLLIWLFLLGIARIVTGRFTPAEIALTIAIGAFCLLGGVSAFRGLSKSSGLAATIAFLVFAGLQILAVWVSTLPQFARD